MDVRILKYGNLMGSPDTKEKLFRAGAGSEKAHQLWLDLFRIKTGFELNGQSTSAILLENEIPDYFPAIIDFSYISPGGASLGEDPLGSALDGLKAQGLKPSDIKSLLVTHLHPDHFDHEVLAHLPQAQLFAPPQTKLGVARPITDDDFGGLVQAIDTPGHGGPHVSYLVDLPDLDLSVCFAGDLVMSHAHYLSLDHPLSFTDHDQGKKSIETVISALKSRGQTYQMFVPGHDIPFFID